jgi:DNA-binding NarL/FixJ family response regulator
MRFALEPDLQIVAEADDGEAALAIIPEVKPNVVLMDVAMPRMDGIAATRLLRRLAPQTAVIVLSLHGDPPTRVQARDAGAVAFVDKHEDTDMLLAIIRRVAAQSESPSNDSESLRPKAEN